MDRTPAEEHKMAQHSALHTVRDLKKVRHTDVMRLQGLCEIRAKKALEDLFRVGVISKEGKYYIPRD